MVSRYDPEKHPEKVRRLCEDGAVDTEIAAALKISLRTLARWKNRHPDLREAMETAKLTADDQVEAALFKRALGYDFEEMETIDGERSCRRIKRRHMPADVTAMIFWLKNRRRQQWGDRQADLDDNEQTKIDELLKRMEGEADAILQPQAGEEVQDAAESLES